MDYQLAGFAQKPGQLGACRREKQPLRRWKERPMVPSLIRFQWTLSVSFAIHFDWKWKMASRRDTVLDWTDLISEKIDPHTFFEENYLADGMRRLLLGAFERFEKKSDQEIFLLTQSMGSGKKISPKKILR